MATSKVLLGTLGLMTILLIPLLVLTIITFVDVQNNSNTAAPSTTPAGGSTGATGGSGTTGQTEATLGTVTQGTGSTNPPATSTKQPASTTKKATTTTANGTVVSKNPGFQSAANMLLAGMDQSADPCQDFYQYACGQWVEQHQLTEDESAINSFDLVQGNINQAIAKNLTTINLDTPDIYSSSVLTAAFVYQSCRDSGQNYPNPNEILKIIAKLNTNGWPIITKNWNTTDAYDPASLIATLDSTYNLPTLMQSYVTVNIKNIAQNQLYVGQATLGLGARQYYINPLFKDSLTAYRDLIADVATIMCNNQTGGCSPDVLAMIPQKAQEIVDYEVSVAQRTIPSTEMRNYTAQYNSYTYSELTSRFVNFNWDNYFLHLLGPHFNKMPTIEQYVISQPGFMDEILADFNNFDPVADETLINYLIWRLVFDNLDFVSSSIGESYTSLQVKVKTLRLKALPPSPDDCATVVVNNLPYVAGYLYVSQNFPNASTVIIDGTNMINSLLSSFSTMLSQLNWYDPQTLNGANKKITDMVRNVAYPSWSMYTVALDQFYAPFAPIVDNKEVGRYLDVLNEVKKTVQQQMFVQLTQPGNRANFQSSPALVNAWYQPDLNSITFPAAIFNPPYYRLDFPKSFNYGALGSIMGHELSHAFDDEGTQFYDNGTLLTWMSFKSQVGFQQQADCIRSEYNQFCYPEAYEYLCVDGTQTQGENIADNGGIVASYNAYQNYKMLHGDEQSLPGLEGFSSDQLFFLSNAHLWCNNMSPSSVRSQVLTNPHSPGYYRVFGVYKNFDAFGEAFGCTRGDPYYPQKVDQCPMYQSDTVAPKSKEPKMMVDGKKQVQKKVEVTASTCNTKGCQDAANEIKNAMNASVDPCDNFYQFACGNWLKTTKLVTGLDMTTAAYQQQMMIMQNVTNYLETSVNLNSSTSSPASYRTAKMIYDSCIQSKDDPNATQLLSAINDLPTLGWPMIQNNWKKPPGYSVEGFIGQLDGVLGIQTLLTSVVDVDLQNPKEYSLSIDQATLGLGYRQYYIDPRYMTVLQNYTQLIINVATQLAIDSGISIKSLQQQIPAGATTIVNIEVQLARKTTPRSDRRVLSQMYNTYDLKGLQTRWPFFNWADYFNNLLGLHIDPSKVDKFVIVEPGYIDEMHGPWGYNPVISDYANYLVWRYVYVNLAFMGAPYSTLYQNFVQSLASSSLLPPPQFECANLITENMPYVAGDIYLFMNNELLQQGTASGYVDNVKSAISSIINSLGPNGANWLDTISTNNAQQKLKMLTRTMNYPSIFLDPNTLDNYYSMLSKSVTTGPGAFFNNYNAIRFFNAHGDYQLIGQPVTNEYNFFISPASVNAVYFPRRNSLSVAAGALSPPYFRSDFPNSFIFGAFGNLVGREMARSLDDQGIQLNYTGGFGQLYTPDTVDNYTLMTQCLIGEYSQYCYPEYNYLCIDGINTLGENIADNLGIMSAYNAYQTYVSKNGPEPPLPGLEQYTAEQILFMSYGQSMCEMATDMGFKEQIQLSTLPPSKDRVNGALRNFDAFKDAFNCPNGAYMAPADDVHCNVYTAPYQPAPPTQPPPVVSDSAGWKNAANQLSASVNTSLDPCQDFYQFACSKWLQSHPISPAHTVVTPIVQLQTMIYNGIASTLDQIYAMGTNNTIPSSVQTAAKAYTVCKTANQATYANLSFIVNALQDAIGHWPMITPNYVSPISGKTSIFGDIGTLESAYALPTLLSSSVDVDWENVAKQALYIDEAKLVLTSRDYYINPLYHDMLDQYQMMIADVSYQICQSTKCGVNNDTINQYAKDIVRFETDIARKKVPENERRNFKSQFNEFNITTLQNRWPSIDWDDYLTSLLALHINVSQFKAHIVVLSPNYVDELNGDVLVDENFENMTTLTNYLGWRLVYENLAFFPNPTMAKYNKLFKGSQHGVTALPLTNVACVNLITDFMPFAVGNAFVSPNLMAINQAEQNAQFISQTITQSFETLFQQLTWQDDTTKVLGLNKVTNMVKNFGYPDWILNKASLDNYYIKYTQMILPPDVTDFWQILNMMRYLTVGMNFKQLLQTPSRDTWYISPAKTEAVYSPTQNSFTISGALFNQPLYESDFPQAVNYGSLGVIISHELVHAFDDIGVQFTSNGTLNMWMTPQSYNNFIKMEDCVINKYNTYCYPPSYIDMCVNGINTQAENIADIGGLEAAYHAYQSYELAFGTEPRLPGTLQNYTMEQVFFMSYAQTMCSNVDQDLLVLELQSGLGSPAQFRVNGAVSNFYKFGEAFMCPVGSPMFPPTADTCPVYEIPPTTPFTPASTSTTRLTTKTTPPAANTTQGYQDAADQIKPSLNQSVNPCQDFYHFSCGNWIKKHQPTAEVPFIDVGIVAQNQINNLLASQLAALPVNDKNNVALSAAATVYQQCLSSKSYDANVILNAISADFPTVNGWPIITKGWTEDPNFDPYEITAKLEANYLISTLLTSAVDVDWKDHTQNMLYIQQGTLGLGNRQFYLNPYFSSTLVAYQQLIISVANYFNTFNGANKVPQDQINTDAKAILDFEINLARKTVPEFEKRDFENMYKEFKFFDFEARFPEIGRPSWMNYFSTLLQFSHSNFTQYTRMIVTQQGYIDQLEGEIQQYDPYEYANYLMWRLVFANLEFLPPMQTAYQEFYKVWKGVQAIPNKESQCVELVNRFFPYVTGYLFIQGQNESNINESVSIVGKIAEYVITASLVHMNNQSFLDYDTKGNLLTKISNAEKQINIGYPPESIDLVALNKYYMPFGGIIGQTDFWSILHFTQFNALNINMQQLTQAPMLTQFTGSPAVVIADYRYNRNLLSVPAALMLSPYYQTNFPMAVNMGGIGAMIAHQVAHILDDLGLQFDKDAILKQNWIPDDAVHGFDLITQCVATQFGQDCYPGQIGMCVDGLNTMEANLADLYSTTFGYGAYRAWVEMMFNHDEEGRLPGLEQYTPDQIYFISYAQQFCENSNVEQFQRQLVMSLDSPGKIRVNGALRNTNIFGQTFNCNRGDYMYPNAADMCYTL